VPGTEGAIYYYYESPDNAVNDWLVHTHRDRIDSPPDFFTAGGMAAARAVVQSLETEALETEALIAAMEGMSRETPKGTMTFRREDHQALRSMSHFKIRVDDGVDWAIPELVREITADEVGIALGHT